MCWVWLVLSQLKIFNYAGGDEEVEAAFENEVNLDENVHTLRLPYEIGLS